MDAAMGVAPEAGRGVADNRRREAHEGRGLDARNPAGEEGIDQGVFERRLIGRVNQVRAPGGAGCVGEVGENGVEVAFDPFKAQTAGPVEGQEAGAGRGADERHRGDARGHGASDIGVAGAVLFVEGAIAQPFGMHGRQQPVDGQAPWVRRRRQAAAGGHAKAKPVSGFTSHHPDRLLAAIERRQEPGGAKFRRVLSGRNPIPGNGGHSHLVAEGEGNRKPITRKHRRSEAV
jgi:hypothetical protein